MLDGLPRELLQQPDPPSGGQPDAGNQGVRPRPEGYVPETEAYLTKQKQIWESERKELLSKLEAQGQQMKALEGYRELFDQMGSHKEYAKILNGWMEGVDLPTAIAKSGIRVPGVDQQDPYSMDATTPPLDAVERLIDERLGQFQKSLRPAVEQLHKLGADNEVRSLLQEHPDAKNYIDGIQQRVRATEGRLSLADAYKLEAFSKIVEKAKGDGRAEGIREAKFAPVEPPAARTVRDPSVMSENQKRIDELLKSGNRSDAAQFAMAEALKEHSEAAGE